MADIFISYAAEDRASIEPLARTLSSQGWTVFWDLKLSAGQTYRDILSKELTESKCVIVAWSKDSVNSRWVIDEAERGLELGRLVPITIDGTIPPLGFRQIHAVGLINWHGDISDPQYISLVSSIRHQVEAPVAPIVGQTAAPNGLKYIENTSRLFLLFLSHVLCVCIHGAIFFGIYVASQNLWFAAGLSLVVNAFILSIVSIMDYRKVSAESARWWRQTDLEWLFNNLVLVTLIVIIYFSVGAWDVAAVAILIFCLTFFPHSYLTNYIENAKLR